VPQSIKCFAMPFACAPPELAQPQHGQEVQPGGWWRLRQTCILSRDRMFVLTCVLLHFPGVDHICHDPQGRQVSA
jgi:hypothetical protein